MKAEELKKYGILNVKEVVYNPSYEVLFNEETKPELTGYEKAQETELGALNVMTGIYTGRSPKDKYIVMDANSKDTVWWNTPEYPNDNHEMSEAVWAEVKKLAVEQLSEKKLYVVDGFCGTNHDTRMKVRFIMEVAWQAHFVTNMFIRPQNQAEFDQEPDFVVYAASKAKVSNFEALGLRSDTCVAFNVTSKEQVILNTWYGGEMKKGMFSMMNYFLPLKGIAAMHCSANTDMNGENTAIFFGLSGTGKTTLSTDPKTSTAGTITASSTSKVAATLRSSSSTRSQSPTSTMPSIATPSSRTSPLTRMVSSTSTTRALPRTPASAILSSTSRTSFVPRAQVPLPSRSSSSAPTPSACCLPSAS